MKTRKNLIYIIIGVITAMASISGIIYIIYSRKKTSVCTNDSEVGS